jgi:eukaryotic-like serine/threonine-protein kinase
MKETRRCSACGAELLEGAAPQGLCPACLLRLGLSSPSVTPPKTDLPAEPPHPAPPIRRQTSWKIWITLAAAVLLLVGAVAIFSLLPRQPPTDTGVIRFSLQPPSNRGLRPINGTADFALSPDGRRIAFVAAGENGQRLLWIHPFDSFGDQPLMGTEEAAFPFWSPNSRWVAFFAQGKLKKIDIAGGGSQTLCLAPSGRGGTWSEEGIILFAPNTFGGLSRVSGNGGSPEEVLPVDNGHGETAYRWPYFLPGGRHFIFSVVTKDRNRGGVYLASLDSHERTKLLNDASPATYADLGQVLFVRGGMLMAQEFDRRKLTLSGEARPVRFAEQISGDTHAGPDFSVSRSGILAYRTRPDATALLTWFDRNGKAIGQVGAPAEFRGFVIAPDGRSIAVSRIDKSADIWILDITRETSSRLTFDPAPDTFPLFSPDGQRVLFLSNREGLAGFYMRQIHDGGVDELIFKSPDIVSLDSWSPDGRFVGYTKRGDRGKTELWVLPLSEDRKPFPAVRSEFNLKQGRISPDGRWLAYVSDESGMDQIFVQTFPESRGKWQVSGVGGVDPQWRRDGKELFYISPEGVLMASPIRAGAAFEAGPPSELFRGHSAAYAVSPEGRFLMATPPPDSSPTPIQIVAGWGSELRLK